MSDIYPSDNCYIRPGVVSRPPAYYDKIFDLTYPESFVKVKLRRLSAAQSSPDNTWERLRVREIVQARRAAKLIRPLEREEV